MKKPKPKTKRRAYIFLTILMFLIGLPFLSYPLSYQPQTNAVDAYSRSVKMNGYYSYSNHESTIGIIVYPGGLVNPVSYAWFAETLSMDSNASVFVTQPLWNLAITNIQAANSIIESNPDIDFWIIGGHSLGGSSAAFFTIDHLDDIQGLFFLASYTTENADFSQTMLPMLSITASEDQILDVDTYQAARAYHSSLTTFVSIEGGNHSQFGDYGLQRGDGVAQINVERQLQLTIAAITSWLATLIP